MRRQARKHVKRGAILLSLSRSRSTTPLSCSMNKTYWYILMRSSEGSSKKGKGFLVGGPEDDDVATESMCGKKCLCDNVVFVFDIVDG
jgi:hypothetical protein